jgi:hypothetical protein
MTEEYCWATTQAAGRSCLRPIRFRCVGVRISTGLSCVCVCIYILYIYVYGVCICIRIYTRTGDNMYTQFWQAQIPNLCRTSRNVTSAWVGVCLSGKEGQGCPSRRVSAFEPSSQNDVGKFAQQILTQTKVVCGFCYEPHNLAIWIPICRMAGVYRIPYTVPFEVRWCKRP